MEMGQVICENVTKINLMVRHILAFRYQFGVIVPRNIQDAYKLYEANGNPLWKNAIEKVIKLPQDDFECSCLA